MSKDITISFMEQKLLPHGLRISKWSPGDGWTRHKVTDPEGGREYSQNMTMAEMRAWFRGFMFAKTNERW